MQPVLSVAAVKEAEQEWARRHGGSTWPLMARAGKAVADLVREQWPGARTIWILAGRGNNGGDGYVAARHLLDRGARVRVIAPSAEPRTDSDAHRAWREYAGEGGQVVQDLPQEDADLVIDAVIGTGHQGTLKPELAALFGEVRTLGAPVLAIDMPSGLEGATGLADDQVLAATATLSFIAYKPGQLTARGPSVCGALHLDPLGIVVDTESAEWREGRAVYVDQPPPWPARPGNSHKGSFGTVRVVAGAQGMGGAGLLAARAALLSGAGRVFWHTESVHVPAALVAQPELMTASLEVKAIPDDAICVLGCGLGFDETAQALYRSLLNRPGQGGVLDADGLTWLSRQPQPVPNWVLTPHPGEAARLLHASGRDVQQDRCQAAVDLSERYQATVVLKGAGSLIASKGRLLFSHPGTSAMATPGMGDVLAGLIASLMAQGLPANSAALTGTWWHALIAAELAESQRVVLATDLIDQLRSPFH